MAENSQGSDMATGLGLLLGLVVVLASIATAGTAYSSELSGGDDTLQLLSGVTVAVAMTAGCLAVAAIHLYD